MYLCWGWEGGRGGEWGGGGEGGGGCREGEEVYTGHISVLYFLLWSELMSNPIV